MGHENFYKFFYCNEQDAEAHAFQKETGWHMIFGSDSQGLNGDTWIVYRDVEDLPKWLQNYARKEESLTLEQNNNAVDEIIRCAIERIDVPSSSNKEKDTLMKE